MKFSVLMSVYKSDDAEYLSRAIESVTLMQTLKPNQLVLVQDGPVGEDIEKVIEAWKDKLDDIEFTVIPQKVNRGLAAALNTGLAECKYEYVARMDSDDVSMPDRFKLQIDYLKNNPGVSVLGGAISEFSKDEAEIMQVRQTPLDYQGICEMVKTRNPMNHVSVMFKKQDIEEIGAYSEDFGKLEDYKLWVDLISAQKLLLNIPDILVNVRVGDGFIERRSNKREIQDWDMLQKYLRGAELISPVKALMNKIYIRVFIYMPGWMKKLAYKTLLRK